MSDHDKKGTENQNPKSDRTIRALMKVAGVLLVVAAATVAVILITNVNTGDNQSGGAPDGDFVVQLDHPGTSNHFMIGTRPGSGTEAGEDVQVAADGSYVLIGQPLGNAWVTTNSSVRDYYNQLIAEKGVSAGLSGSNNYVDPDTNLPAGLIYTFYLNNASETETQTYRIAARLTHDRGQNKQAKGVDVYEYLRLALFIGDDGKADDEWMYFANKSMKSIGLSTDHNDYRECLSVTGWTEYSATEINQYRYPAYKDPDSNIEICELFQPSNEGENKDRGLFDVDQLEIKPGASRRITFLAYLEGADPDCTGEPPQNQKLGFSLHVGL